MSSSTGESNVPRRGHRQSNTQQQQQVDSKTSACMLHTTTKISTWDQQVQHDMCMLFIEECGRIYPSQHPPPRTCGVTSLCACTTYATDRHVATANKQNHLCVCTHSHTKDTLIAPETTPHFTSTPKHASHTPSPSLPNKHQHSSTLAAFPRNTRLLF